MRYSGCVYYFDADGGERVVSCFTGQEARSRSEAVGLALRGLDAQHLGVDLRVRVRPDPDSAFSWVVYPHCVACGGDLLVCERCMDCGSDRLVGERHV